MDSQEQPNEAPLLPMEVLERAAGVLRVMSHPHRLRIIELLMAEPRSVSDLTDRLNLAQNAVSQHLNFMKAHGILTSRREGRNVIYSIADPSATSVLGCIRQNSARYQD